MELPISSYCSTGSPALSMACGSSFSGCILQKYMMQFLSIQLLFFRQLILYSTCFLCMQVVLDYSKYAPPEWIRQTKLHLSPYLPQVGDLVSWILWGGGGGGGGYPWSLLEPHLLLEATQYLLFTTPPPTGCILPSGTQTLCGGSEEGATLPHPQGQDAVGKVQATTPGVLSGDQCSVSGGPPNAVLYHAGPRVPPSPVRGRG